MKWVIVSTEGMPDNEALAVIRGDVEEIVGAIKPGNGEGVTAKAWDVLANLIPDLSGDPES